jgi:heme-degrading monooxygenase HmoA
MRFRSMIQFHVKPGMEAQFEAAFLKAGMLVRPKQVEGFISAELVRSIGEAGEYLVIGEWQSEQAYTDWQAAVSDAIDPQAVTDLYATVTDPVPGRLFASVAQSD